MRLPWQRHRCFFVFPQWQKLVNTGQVTRYSSFIRINSLDSPTFLDILSTGKHRFFLLLEVIKLTYSLVMLLWIRFLSLENFIHESCVSTASLSLPPSSMSLLTPFRVIVCSIISNVTHVHVYVCVHAYTGFTEPCSVVLKKAYLQMTTLDWMTYERPSACRRLNLPPQQQLIPWVSLPTDASVWKCPSPHWSVDWCVHYMGFD